jgi:hypothetical protein
MVERAESGSLLPEISQEQFSKAMTDIHAIQDSSEGLKLAKSMIEKERRLADKLHDLEPQFSDPGAFYFGAHTMYMMMELFGRQGVSFPRVSDRVMDEFCGQVMAVVPAWTSIIQNNPELTESEIVELIKERGLPITFPIPDPEEYFPENPIIMDWIQRTDNTNAWMGAMAVYEMKRRQAIVDRWGIPS